MTTLELKSEISKTKEIKNRLMACIEEGKMEFYQDYIDACTYLLKLTRLNEKTILRIV